MTAPLPWLALLARRADLPLDRLEAYAIELARWNRSIRLVGPGDLAGIRAQVADALLPFLLHPPPSPLLDIGSGAGLPGIPVALAFSECSVTCLEPNSKKTSFLRHASRYLGLRNLRVIQARSEETPQTHPDTIGAFAAATARALGEEELVLSLARPFLAPRGLVYVLGGLRIGAPKPGWNLLFDESYDPPPGIGPRRLTVYELAPS